MASLVSHSSRRHCSRVSYLHAAGGYDLPEVGGAGGTQRPNHAVWGMCFPALYHTHIHFSHAVWIRRDWLWRVSVFTRWNINDPQSLKDKTSHCVLKLDCQFKLFMNVPLTYDPPHACAHRPDWQCAVSGRPWNASVFHLCIILSFSLVGRKCWVVVVLSKLKSMTGRNYVWSHDLDLELCMLPETQELPRPTLPLIGPFCTSHLLVNDRKMSLSKFYMLSPKLLAILESCFIWIGATMSA